jgi:hypothetical protein
MWRARLEQIEARMQRMNTNRYGDQSGLVARSFSFYLIDLRLDANDTQHL